MTATDPAPTRAGRPPVVDEAAGVEIADPTPARLILTRHGPCEAGDPPAQEPVRTGADPGEELGAPARPGAPSASALP